MPEYHLDLGLGLGLELGLEYHLDCTECYSTFIRSSVMYSVSSVVRLISVRVRVRVSVSVSEAYIFCVL